MKSKTKLNSHIAEYRNMIRANEIEVGTLINLTEDSVSPGVQNKFRKSQRSFHSAMRDMLEDLEMESHMELNNLVHRNNAAIMVLIAIIVYLVAYIISE